MFFKKKKITKLNKLYFCYQVGNYMNGSIAYTLDVPKLKLTYKPDKKSEEESITYKVDDSLVTEIENKLNELNVIKWDKFHKSNKRVLDGNCWALSITYKKEKMVYAHGYEKYPRNYKEVKVFLDEIFSKYIK